VVAETGAADAVNLSVQVFPFFTLVLLALRLIVGVVAGVGVGVAVGVGVGVGVAAGSV
jgi:hypothetical protein